MGFAFYTSDTKYNVMRFVGLEPEDYTFVVIDEVVANVFMILIHEFQYQLIRRMQNYVCIARFFIRLLGSLAHSGRNCRISDIGISENSLVGDMSKKKCRNMVDILYTGDRKTKPRPGA
jgi:hypothetical protein